MHSPTPNIPDAISPFTTSPFTEYMKELKTSSNDISELDKKLNIEFACEDSLIHALGIGGTASAGLAALPQRGDLAAARAKVALSCSMGGCTNFFVDDAIVAEIFDQLKSETADPLPVCPQYWQGGAQPQDVNQKPPADKQKHAPLKKPPCQSIIGCGDTGLFLKRAVAMKKEKRSCRTTPAMSQR